jgi:hypothetical protein
LLLHDFLHRQFIGLRNVRLLSKLSADRAGMPVEQLRQLDFASGVLNDRGWNVPTIDVPNCIRAFLVNGDRRG